VRAAAAAAGAIALAAVGGARAALPQTAHFGHEPVVAVAQDGRLLAWLAAGGDGCNTIRALGAGGTTVRAPQPAVGSMTCHWDVSHGMPQLALAAGASAVLWTLHEGSAAATDYVMTAGLGGPEVRVDRLAHASDGTGLWLGGIAGAGITLAYSVSDVEYVNKLGCLSGSSPCKRRIAGGGIHVVTEGEDRLLPGSRPALELAASGGDIAYVQAAAAPTGPPVANARLPIEVVSAADGTPVCSVQPQGVPLALALAPDVLAVLTRSGKRERVSWYEAGSGVRLGGVQVGGGAASQLAASNRLIVYRVGRTLRGISLRTGRTRTLAKAAVTPTGLTLAGSRLAWAENRGTTDRIRTLAVG
jgi:hypothetical protein